YVAPLHGNGEMAAARSAGMHEVPQPIVMRVEGDDRTGRDGRLTQAWEMAGINLHGLVMSVIGGKFVGYAPFDTVSDANKAATILAEVGTALTGVWGQESVKTLAVLLPVSCLLTPTSYLLSLFPSRSR